MKLDLAANLAANPFMSHERYKTRRMERLNY
jgi:hypothetical protein